MNDSPLRSLLLFACLAALALSLALAASFLVALAEGR
jgi:hypothetical protein